MDDAHLIALVGVGFLASIAVLALTTLTVGMLRSIVSFVEGWWMRRQEAARWRAKK